MTDKNKNFKLFTSEKIGPIKLRNRSIRAAAFEGMCPNHMPSDSLVNYHKSVAHGGIGMTTVAYISVDKSGLTFSHQAYMCDEIVPGLKKVTDAVHREGALASVQLGHAGNMADKKITGQRAIAPSGVFTLFGLSLPKKMTENDIDRIAKAYGNSVNLARKAGFDAVEIHAGHGYLISQFITPYTNRRKDKWGGPFENRIRFLRKVMQEVKNAAKDDIAVLVKMNLEDGFKGGMGLDEGIEVAKVLEEEGADALVLSGGFTTRSPLYMLKGRTPHKELISYQTSWLIKIGMIFFSRIMLKDYPYSEAFFLESALKIRESVKLPLVYVGGIVSLKTIEKVLGLGFNFIQIARALFLETDFINRLSDNPDHISQCLTCSPEGPCNKCVATMYNGEARCLHESLI